MDPAPANMTSDQIRILRTGKKVGFIDMAVDVGIDGEGWSPWLSAGCFSPIGFQDMQK